MSTESFFVLGATHARVPIEVREKLALAPESETAFHSELSALQGLREYAILSTCNRVEFYGVAEDEAAIRRLEAAFCERQRFDVAEFQRIRMELRGRAALEHLMEVAAGLDSQMLGETEIFGQVKEAYAASQKRRSAGPILNKVFQKSFQAAKHVRSSTAITAGHVSVANVAVDLALNIFGGLSEIRILLLGAGEIGEKTARAFQSRGAEILTVASRTFGRAMELATELRGTALPFDQAPERLGDFDIVVCATAAPDPVVSLAAATAAMKRRPARPLFFIDLALPRDVDSAVSGLDNAFLYNLDDLAKIAEDNRASREAEIATCRALLSERAERLWRQLSPRIGNSASEAQAQGSSAAKGIQHA